MTGTIRDTGAMLAGMTPTLEAGEYVFCTLAEDAADSVRTLAALAMFHETEGLSLILERAAAARAGFDTALPMRQIILQVHSSLEGVGLTAAVASALATAGIPCNMVATYHHDHVFVPVSQAEAALAVLQAVQEKARQK